VNGTVNTNTPPGRNSRRALRKARSTGGTTCSNTSLAVRKSYRCAMLSGMAVMSRRGAAWKYVFV
jgi:hypothetical protein